MRGLLIYAALFLVLSGCTVGQKEPANISSSADEEALSYLRSQLPDISQHIQGVQVAKSGRKVNMFAVTDFEGGSPDPLRICQALTHFPGAPGWISVMGTVSGQIGEVSTRESADQPCH
jgi:hypothetical protein